MALTRLISLKSMNFALKPYFVLNQYDSGAGLLVWPAVVLGNLFENSP